MPPASLDKSVFYGTFQNSEAQKTDVTLGCLTLYSIDTHFNTSSTDSF